MHQFWTHGYEATSVDHLVKATGVGRGALYSDFGGKRDLFLACLDCYKSEAVSPAFSQVEADGAGLAEIKRFVEAQIDGMFSLGFPLRGCLVGNATTELSAHDPDIAREVLAHYDRLTAGFARALVNEAGKNGRTIDIAPFESLARTLTIGFQGLCAYARGAQDEDAVRGAAKALLEVVSVSFEAEMAVRDG